MEKIESVQYSAALAVTGTWRGTSRAKLYAELGWESLSSRRWSRRLTLFYKIINNLTPLYTKEPIPPLHQSSYSLRNQDAIGRMKARTEKFQSSFYPNCTSEWNKLDPEIRLNGSHIITRKPTSKPEVKHGVDEIHPDYSRSGLKKRFTWSKPITARYFPYFQWVT